MATLFFKLGVLMMKTISKPLGDRFKNWIMQHPEYRSAVMRVAQTLHRYEVNISRRAEGRQGKVIIGQMTEEAGMELASKVASEGFVFGVGALLLFLEYDRSRRKEVAAQRKKSAEMRALQEAMTAERERLIAESDEQEELIDQLLVRTAKLEELTQQLYRELEETKRRSSWFGGFLGLRALPVPVGEAGGPGSTTGMSRTASGTSAAAAS